MAPTRATTIRATALAGSIALAATIAVGTRADVHDPDAYQACVEVAATAAEHAYCEATGGTPDGEGWHFPCEEDEHYHGGGENRPTCRRP